MPTCRAPFDEEISLSEMLVDPIVQAVMLRDGTTSDEVAALIDRVRRQLAAGRPDAFQASRPVPESAAYQEPRCTP
jgi:hypothetical protein